MKDPFHYTDNDLYELMHERGERRFGSECRHEHTRNGVCLNCLRRVIDRVPAGGVQRRPEPSGKGHLKGE